MAIPSACLIPVDDWMDARERLPETRKAFHSFRVRKVLRACFHSGMKSALWTNQSEMAEVLETSRQTVSRLLIGQQAVNMKHRDLEQMVLRAGGDPAALAMSLGWPIEQRWSVDLLVLPSSRTSHILRVNKIRIR